MNEKKQSIKNKLKDIYSLVLKREIDDEQFTFEPGLTERLHIDSLLGLQIIVKIEQNFNLVIEDDEVAIKILDDLSQAIALIQDNYTDTIFLER